MLELLSLPFIQRALIVGILISISTALLGTFVVLKKISFFGDTIAHSAFTGIALGFLIGIDPSITSIIMAVIVALLIPWIQSKSDLSDDTIIGVFFSTAAALGILMIGLLKGYKPDLFQYLFGDILAITQTDVTNSIVLTLLIFIIMAFIKKSLTLATFNQDLAITNNINPQVINSIFLVLLAVTIGLSIKIIGIILATALVVIPAASAKNISQNFSQMTILSVIFGLFSSIIGIFASYYLNVASGASIVLTSVLIFIITLIIKK